MKLSLVFELLLIFVLLAFAASKSVGKNKQKSIQNRNDSGSTVTVNDEKQEDSSISSINKYCKCSEAFCNCCRDFAVPYVNLDGPVFYYQTEYGVSPSADTIIVNDEKQDARSISTIKCSEAFTCYRNFTVPYVDLDAPGCASLRYLNGDKMSVSLSFGRKVITNKTLTGRKPSPVCMPLPGGVSKFCGRVYNIARTGEEFRACLGLELQSKRSVEAAVRVSCFKFGPRGVRAEPADPLPLVPQDEKPADDDDDDDDDDEDDDFGLGDDDEDDDGDLDGINDVDTADYTGFSLLSEDLLGDLFGSGSSEKKSNKNRKKQAPLQSTTTTTTKRPRTTRPRTTRRPNTRTTTPRTAPVRTTTVRVRPVNRRTRRPTRKPGGLNRKPTASVTTSVEENSLPSSVASTATTTASPLVENPTTAGITSTERFQFLSTANDEIYQPIVIVTQRPSSTVSLTTQKAATNFADPGLEMSLAQLTGQLAAMPASPILPEGAKDTGIMTSRPSLVSYEKIETITPKGTTVAFASSDQKVNDDMVQIVHSLDSSSEEQTSEKAGEENRSQKYIVPVPVHYEGLTLPKKNRQFSIEDLDVLNLSQIGETVGEQIGLFGRKKRQNKVQNNQKPQSESEDEEDDDDETSDYDVLGLEQIGEIVGEQVGLFGRGKRQNNKKVTIDSNQNIQGEKGSEDYDEQVIDDFAESLALDRSAKNKVNNKRDRRRQNKMMRGDWSHSEV